MTYGYNQIQQGCRAGNTHKRTYKKHTILKKTQNNNNNSFHVSRQNPCKHPSFNGCSMDVRVLCSLDVLIYVLILVNLVQPCPKPRNLIHKHNTRTSIGRRVLAGMDTNPPQQGCRARRYYILEYNQIQINPFPV